MSESAVYPDLFGKVAVVTGAARGMGARFARGLLAQGVDVVGGDLDAEGVARTAAEASASVESGRTMLGESLDVTHREDHDRLAQIALDRFGRLDLWINNAGIFPQAPVTDITRDQLDATFSVNVGGVLFGAQAAAAAMTSGGSIVNLASTAALRVRPTRATYSVSKAAVDHLTRFLAVELAGRGIRVNAVAPGAVDTDMTSWIKESPDILAQTLAGIPVGRMGAPEDILNAVLFLLSDSSSYITGATIVVDGGAQHAALAAAATGQNDTKGNQSA